jgi:hypothetical protein
MVSVTWRYDYAYHEDETVETPSSVSTDIRSVSGIEAGESPPAEATAS